MKNTTIRNSLIAITVPKNSYWLERFGRHLALAAAAVAIVWVAHAATPPPDIRHRVSMATAYAGLIFLAASLWSRALECSATACESNQLRSAPGCGYLDWNSGDYTYSSRFDRPSPRTDVDVFLQTASSDPAAKHAIRLCQFRRTRRNFTLRHSVGDFKRSFSPYPGNTPLEISPEMDLCGNGADGCSWHCLSIGRKAPSTLGPDFRWALDHGCHRSTAWSSLQSQAE